MLFVIDMQNDFVDSIQGKYYVKEAEGIVQGVIDKIKQYEKKKDKIFYTLDINLKTIQKYGNNNDESSIIVGETKSNIETKLGFQPYKLLEPYLKNHEEIKKTYYAIPPETLLDIQDRFKEDKSIVDKIEFIGVETNICVLANAICIQSAFPESKIIIDATLCKSKSSEDHERALEIMKSLGMKIRR